MKEYEIRTGRSVDRAYAGVRDIIAQDAIGLFRRATTSSTVGGESNATLHASLAGHEVHRDICIEITSFDSSGRPPSAQALPGFAIAFKWWDASSPSMFPSMRASLTGYGLSREITQLDVHAWYTPPAGALGAMMDTLNQHHIAEESVRRFLDDTVRRLAIDVA